MRILKTYLIEQISLPLIISALTLTLIFIFGNVVKIADLILNRGVDFFEFVRFLVLIIPEMLTFTLPTSLLTAILLVFGDLSENNEIIAIKACGIHLLRVMVPVFMLGLFLSVVVMIISDQVLPNFSFESRKTLKKIFLNDPFAHMRAGIPTKILDEFVFLAREVNDSTLKNVTIYQPMEDGPTRTIMAEICELEHVGNKVKVNLYNGTIDEPDTKNPSIINKLDFEQYELPIVDLENIDSLGKKTREYNIAELWAFLRRGVGDERKRLQYQIEIFKKISFSFSCFVFAIVGVPIAIITRRGNLLISCTLAIGLLTVYYVLYSWMQAVAMQGVLQPSVALWIPSLVFILIGIILSVKVCRH